MGTVIVGTIVLSAFVGVGYYLYSQKHKAGSCCSGCSGCPSTSNCQK